MISRTQKPTKFTMVTPISNVQSDHLQDKAFLQSETKEKINALLLSGPNLNVRGEGGWTLLHLVAKNGSSDNVKEVLDAGVDINVRDTQGETPLHVAAQTPSIENMQLLLEAGADVNLRNRQG